MHAFSKTAVAGAAAVGALTVAWLCGLTGGHEPGGGASQGAGPATPVGREPPRVPLAASVTGGSTGGDQEDGATTEPRAFDCAAAGVIAGRAVFHGVPPRRRPVRMSGECACLPGAPALTETVVVDAGGGLKNVLVCVVTPMDGWAFEAPVAPVVVDQRGCRYEPHVFALMEGQALVVRNSDPLPHVVRIEPRGIEFSMGAKAPERRLDLKAGRAMLKITCPIHPWMGAWGRALPHPWFAVTGDDGTFELPPLPAGDYELEAWHERCEPRTATVRVEAAGRAETMLEFTAPDE